MKKRHKQIYLFGVGEDGAETRVFIQVMETEKISKIYVSHQTQKSKNTSHQAIRSRDKAWIYHNIPSSIWWFNEMHHDWGAGGVLYLLSPQKHRETTNKERAVRQRQPEEFLKRRR